MMRARWTLLLLSTFSMYVSLSIILKQTTNYANSTKNEGHSADFKWSFFPLDSLASYVYFFDKSSEATGHASLCVICQQEMNGYVKALLRAFVYHSLQRTATNERRGGQG